MAFGPTLDLEPRALRLRVWVLGFGLGLSFAIWVSCLRLGAWVSGFVPWASGLGPQGLGLGLWTLGFGS